MNSHVTRFKTFFEFMVTAAMGVAAVLLIWRVINQPTEAGPRGSAAPPAAEDIASSEFKTSVGNAPTVGSAKAQVALIEYSDFECPFCARHATTTYDEITSNFLDSGRVMYIFRDFPIDEIHPSAIGAAQAADCAHRQGKFIQAREHLFASQKLLAQLDWHRVAPELGMDATAFTQCLATANTGAIEAVKAEAARFGVQSTPTFLVGKLSPKGEVRILARIKGAAPYSTFERALKDALFSE